MNPLQLPRPLTPDEMSELDAMKARENDIFSTAGWFIPAPDGKRLSALADKGRAYILDSLEIAGDNATELAPFLDIAAFQNAYALHQQASHIEDRSAENIVAPHSVALLSGAAAKRFADDQYSVAKSLARLSAKWTAIVERLAQRYKAQGERANPNKNGVE